ncbi:MAG: dicarboxylate/amino acid:cation symporter [Gammaproteobacteria bacterium]|nr:dicarboxylate/amino acid:cation symporter [Gammaproteobacteria bacterium]
MRLKLHWQILGAMALAVAVGSWSGTQRGVFGVPLYPAYDFLGTLFLNSLKMLVVPLIVSSIVVGIAGIGSGSALGRLGGKTLLYYATTSLLAILVGLAMVNLISPGLVDGNPAQTSIGLHAIPAEVVRQVEGKGSADVATVFLRLVPANVFRAAANGQMLGLIFFSLLFGYFMTKIDHRHADTLLSFWQGVLDVMMGITNLVMRFAPLGVFALVAKVVSGTDLNALGDLLSVLLRFTFTVLAALAIHAFVVLPLLLRLVAGVNPLRHYRAMAPALLTAFSTASSSATLPLTMECVEKNAGVSNRVTSFVLPLGATMNMDGTALYECVAALFIAQAYGVDLGFGAQFTVVVTALLTSVGVAGIPAASLVAITIILAAVGLPVEGIGLILAVDRILDMFRTSVNVFSDSCGAVIIGRLEGERGLLAGGSPEARGRA